MTEFIIPSGVLDSLSDWLTSTTRLFFYPSSFAASLANVAFTIFQFDNAHWHLLTSLTVEIFLVGLWCLYGGALAVILKSLRATQAPLLNIIICFRIQAIFYLLQALLGILAFLLFRSHNAFFITFLSVSFLLHAIVFPPILSRLNDLNKACACFLVLACIVLGLTNGVIATEINHKIRSGGPPTSDTAPPTEALPPVDSAHPPNIDGPILALSPRPPYAEAVLTAQAR